MSGGRQSTLPQAWRLPAQNAPEKENEEVADDELLLAAEPALGFCEAAGSIWIYPTNYPVRGYQERMARAALLGNTLVCLPTGLGKTFVAAVVMYNFYRWFPSGKVLFLAPTKPLVAQQMEACARVMGIPGRHMAEMTGGTQALSRKELWATKRVFFLTPQIMVNDLCRGTCPAVEVKCLVIDEAHKALGNHAYCQVVRELIKYTNQFRVLALSATPGSDTKAVQQVISNLLIAQIELCTEDSPEIQPYSHERLVEKVVVPLGEELTEIQNAYIRVLETFAGRLIKIGVLARRDIPSLTKYQIILARDQYRKNPSSQNMGMHQGIIEGDFALCISLYHGYELLLQMGLRSLYIYLCGIMDGSKGLTRAKNELGRNEDFMKLYQQLAAMFSDASQALANGNVYKPVFENKKEFIYSHPKLRKLEEIVVKHFKSWKTGCSAGEGATGSTSAGAADTRVMIFSSFRDSVQEIAEMLSRLSPLVRAMTFVGHSTGKSTKGFTQREQLEVVKRFREGGYNTLVSTCVGEEGLDIGEVDLIICFDAQKSPTYNQSQSNKRSIHKALSGNKTLRFYQHSPRMIPEGVDPKLHKMFITAEKYDPSDSRMLSREKRCSSLQHKSALFSCVTGQKQIQCHESWSLSAEEFETWDRLYRIKESDGIKEPILPQTRFETLENLEEISLQQHEDKATHELSLSEWRIWQNRPFPTFMVDHSDRCCHFIRVMEMIELMRLEQGDCGYELELQPHLRMEDVTVQRNKSHLSMSSSTSDQKACSSRKDVAHRSKVKPFSPDTNDNGSEFFTTFKITKPKALKRTSRADLEVAMLPSDPGASGSGSASRLALLGSTDQHSPNHEELQVTFDLNGRSDGCDSSASAVIQESAAIKEHETVGEACRSLGKNHADSGYSSFTAETSPVSPDLFYLSESYVNSFALVRPSEEPPWLEQVFSHVKRLLSQSPPALNKLDDFENVMRNEETICPFQKGISDSYSERLRDRVCSVSSEGDRSLQLFENPELDVGGELCAPVSTCLPKPVSSPETAAVEDKEELHWNDSFDSLFDNEEFTEIQKKTPTMNHTLTNNPSKYSVQKDTEDLDINKKNVVIAGEQSVRLFEDDPTAREDIPELPVTDQVDPSPRRQDVGSSAGDALGSPLGRTGNATDTTLHSSRVSPAQGTSSESEEEIVCQRKNRKRMNVLKSPDVMNDSDFESPIRPIRKRRHLLNMSDASSDDSADLHKNSGGTTKSSWNKKQLRRVKRLKVKSGFTYKKAARQFLDEEAELSQQDADAVSSDESDDAESELSSSLAQFLNDDAEVTGVLNDSEMKGVYLKSVRSPALGNRYKMVHREFDNMDIFSQIPEQDQAYAEDSFCVGEEEEDTCKNSESSEEEVCVNFDLLNTQSFAGGRKQYLTRRRKKLNQARMEESCSEPTPKKKPARIIVLSDSSGEETSVSQGKATKTDCLGAERESAAVPRSLPSVSAVQRNKTAGEISVRQPGESKSEKLLSLKASLCALRAGDYVVSNCMAVERRLRSELLGSADRRELAQRIQRLRAVFERVCVIVEKDRSKPGELSRPFQRPQHYDGTLSALVQAGVRLLFSSCQEETAALLRDLALVEQRKSAAIRVPTEPRGHRRDLLNFYLSIPRLSYPAALNMCHHFDSLRNMANSSPQAIATAAQVSAQKAEEIHRYLHHGFDAQLLPESLCAKGTGPAGARS
ncbi:Fancm [Columba guinea]|nr:Fancm [Columba guinea]